MSWLFSRVLAEAYSEDVSSDGGPFARSSGTLTPRASSFDVKTTESSNPFQCGTMSERSTVHNGEDLLTWYRAAFLVKTSPSPEAEPVSMESGPDYGPRWLESSVRFDRGSSSWKTHRQLFAEVLDESSVILPRWGMIRDGVVFQRPKSELHTDGIDFGSLLPTPVASDIHHRKTKYAQGGSALSFVIGGPLNPNWVEWLMGWPIGWTDSGPLEMAKFRRWLDEHGRS
jgi:hypothetical protein